MAAITTASGGTISRKRQDFGDENCFSKTGHLTERVREVSKCLNPDRALFNCPITTLKTASLLEHGVLPSKEDLGLSFPHLPRPMPLEEVKRKWADCFKLRENRGMIVLENVHKDTLDTIMLTLGLKTHAMIGGSFKCGISGHSFNYVVSGDLKHKKLEVIDSYSKRHQERGKNQDVYFGEYKDVLQEAIIFYERTDENDRFVSKYQYPSDFPKKK